MSQYLVTSCFGDKLVKFINADVHSIISLCQLIKAHIQELGIVGGEEANSCELDSSL